MSEKKSCFIVMPISDQEGYEKGHFTRVYNHIIKPACEKAGFEAIRADDEVKTNYIALDIVKKIIESDLVLCDISSKNPNVLYELGIRQAFNKKVVLIKDTKTSRIFDIQGFRTIDYDHNLRIDEVEKNIVNISNTINETYNSKEGEINSFLQLLSIKPASLSENIEISQESTIILDMLMDISDRITNIENPKKINSKQDSYVTISGMTFKIGENLSCMNNGTIGEIIDFKDDFVIVKKDNIIKQYKITDKIFDNLFPF